MLAVPVYEDIVGKGVEELRKLLSEFKGDAVRLLNDFDVPYVCLTKPKFPNVSKKKVKRFVLKFGDKEDERSDDDDDEDGSDEEEDEEGSEEDEDEDAAEDESERDSANEGSGSGDDSERSGKKRKKEQEAPQLGWRIKRADKPRGEKKRGKIGVPQDLSELTYEQMTPEQRLHFESQKFHQKLDRTKAHFADIDDVVAEPVTEIPGAEESNVEPSEKGGDASPSADHENAKRKKDKARDDSDDGTEEDAGDEEGEAEQEEGEDEQESPGKKEESNSEHLSQQETQQQMNEQEYIDEAPIPGTDAPELWNIKKMKSLRFAKDFSDVSVMCVHYHFEDDYNHILLKLVGLVPVLPASIKLLIVTMPDNVARIDTSIAQRFQQLMQGKH